MRLLPASLGIAVVPIAYLTLRSMGCRPATCLLASLLITFENGLITQSRLILLDSPLLFYTALTVFFWSGFCAEDARKAGSSCQGPFSRTWWAWLGMTGLCLGLTLSCKWVGLFTIATVGLATIEQLWQILGDTKIPMKTIGRHFVARAICLMGITISVYMWWFWIHFLVLNHSGDGDGFMSSEFQHTLRGHGMPDTFAGELKMLRTIFSVRIPDRDLFRRRCARLSYYNQTLAYAGWIPSFAPAQLSWRQQA